MRIRGVIGWGSLIAVMAAGPVMAASGQQLTVKDVSTFSKTASSIELPEIETPQWLVKQRAAKRAAEQAAYRAVPAGSHVVSYTVSTQGNTRSNLSEFAAQANATLNDSRGWARLGLSFKQVPSGGSFTLILAEASEVGHYPGCSAAWSCRVGTAVLVNDDRWSGATAAWNSAGGGLRDYRHMVVNHEVGHWLGHGHAHCSGGGQLAPIMQQQSIDLEGCEFNPWPLKSELSSSRFGV